MPLTLDVFACVRSGDQQTLQQNLAASPELQNHSVPLTVLWNKTSAATAYNEALHTSKADVCVFAHSDVYFPKGWFSKLEGALSALSARDPNWAIGALVGIAADGTWHGRAWDTGLNRLLGAVMNEPARILSLDEFVFFVRRDAGLAFDPNVPDFHLYGCDLVLSAEQAGRSAYAVDLPVIHNSKPVARLPAGFIQAYRHVTRKWRTRLPVPGIIVTLTTDPWPLLRRRLQIRYKGLVRKSTMNFSRLTDPRQTAIELGLETP